MKVHLPTRAPFEYHIPCQGSCGGAGGKLSIEGGISPSPNSNFNLPSLHVTDGPLTMYPKFVQMITTSTEIEIIGWNNYVFGFFDK
jgi:hypothetical protein